MAEDPAAPFDDAVLLALVLSAHGLKGEVKLKIFTETPEAIKSYGALISGDGRQIEVSSLRAVKGGEALAQLKGFCDRSAAESLDGQYLYVPRSALPDPGEEEFYHADLIGLRAEDESGKVLGKIVGVQNFGAGDLIEIADEKGATRFVAFTPETVPLIDLESQRVVVGAAGDED
jgi:16S rRNA processing protein RimM